MLTCLPVASKTSRIRIDASLCTLSLDQEWPYSHIPSQVFRIMSWLGSNLIELHFAPTPTSREAANRRRDSLDAWVNTSVTYQIDYLRDVLALTDMINNSFVDRERLISSDEKIDLEISTIIDRLQIRDDRSRDTERERGKTESFLSCSPDRYLTLWPTYAHTHVRLICLFDSERQKHFTDQVDKNKW